MRRATHVLCALYGWLIYLYPLSFRTVFGEEMEAVFAAAVTEAGSRGSVALARFWLRELHDLPGAVVSAYWSSTVRKCSQVNRQGGISMDERRDGEKANRPWAIDDRFQAALAALPPLVMGLGIAAGATINGRSWFDLTAWQQVTLILLAVLPAGILGVGGLIALIRSIPEWSYAWVGGTFVAAILLVKILAEERAEVGASIISPAVDVSIALVLVLAGGVVLIIAAVRGWGQAGLTSVGFVSVFGITTFSLLRAAPFHRNDLVLLAAPLGLLQGLLTYIYVRRGRAKAMQWAIMLCVWLLNAAPMLLAHRVWQPWLAARGRTSPVVPLLVIVTILAWAGPVVGLLGRPVRRSLGRA